MAPRDQNLFRQTGLVLQNRQCLTELSAATFLANALKAGIFSTGISLVVQLYSGGLP